MSGEELFITKGNIYIFRLKFIKNFNINKKK